ncbi:phospholipase-like protein [Tanacetum coccineum]
MNDLERNSITLPLVTVNTKFLNCLQPEWLKHVTQVHLAKRLTEDTYNDLFDYLQQFEKLVNASRAKKLEKSQDPLALVAHTSSTSRTTSPYYVTHPSSVVDYDDDYRGGKNVQNDAGNIQQTLRTTSSGSAANVQCYNCSEKGLTLTNEQNDFLVVDATRMEEIEELSVNICLMDRIQPTNIDSNAGPSYDFAFLSEVQTPSTSYVNPLFAKDNQEQKYPKQPEIINNIIGDDQIDRNIIFDEPNVDVNSGSVEHDNNVQASYALEQLALNAYKEAWKQQINANKDYVCKVIIRSKLNYFWFIKQKLDVKRRILFRSTCFGPWLDLMLFDHEPLLIDYMLRRQHKVDDQHHDMPLIYYMEGHKLHFGRREFSLITGFRFGTVSFDLHSSGELKFRNRVFPNKIGFSITNLDIIGVIEDEEIFGKLSDDDAIRLCLLLALEVIFMGRLLTFNVDDTLFSLVENIEAWNSFPWGEHLWCHLYDEIKNLKERHGDEHYYGLFKDRNYVPTYTLSGFVFAFQILETFERCESWWIKDPKVIPRALGWSKKSLFTRSDYPFLFAKESRSTSDLRPTIAEYQSSWWIDNNLYFQEFVPRAPPIKEHHGLFETYLSKFEKSRKRGKTGFMVSSIGGTTDNNINFQVLSHERNDRQAKLKFNDEFSSMTSDLCDSLNSMFADLIELADPDKDIGQDYLREEKLGLCLEGEEKMCCEHQKLIVEENKIRLDESKRLRLEEENMLQLEQ